MRRFPGRFLIGLWLMEVCMAPAGATDWYVGPGGTAAGQGTREAPWDIETTLRGERGVKPGDTVLLLEGTYRRRPQEQFEVRLAGTAEKRILVRPAPGAHAVIDGGLRVEDPSAYLWIQDLEILVSEPQAAQPVEAGSHPESFKRPWGGLNIYGGKRCKFIDLVIHGTRQAVSWWIDSEDSELYGCILYDNGWPAVDRGHGHAIYTQNDRGVKTISDCIMTGGYGYTLHAYGSARAFVNNYLVEGNLCYNAGAFLIGGGRPSQGIRVLHNYLYSVPMQIGYDAPYNEDCEVRDNVIVNGELRVEKYRKVVSTKNLVLARSAPRPAGTRIVFRPNKYDPQRAHLAIFNWEKRPAATVRPGTFLKVGERYRLMDPRDLFGRPVLEDAYTGRPISVPMTGEFAVFVLVKSG
jgi:hypothetical protein